MRDPDPKDVLADLFSDPDFAIAILDPKRAAEIVIRWLLAAGFEVVPAKEVRGRLMRPELPASLPSLPEAIRSLNGQKCLPDEGEAGAELADGRTSADLLGPFCIKSRAVDSRTPFSDWGVLLEEHRRDLSTEFFVNPA